MSHPAITVENLGKAYRIGLKEEIPDTLVGATTSWMKAPVRNFHRLRRLNTFSAQADQEEEDIVWALRDVSFEVAEGEVLGIIGRNGAGKSTLLKILSRITEPTTGRATIHGRVSSLLEVGTGFHPELSGRENIYMNGTILGMTKREIDQKFDEIVAFSGVERFLDTPIKRYSSGMKVRLAFSVAAHLEPEILIIDEVLAVGDAEFQKKCLAKMEGVATQGRTVLFVSHNMGAIQSLCRRALAIRNGSMVDDGESSEVIRQYLSEQSERAENTFSLANPERTNAGFFRFTSGVVLDSSARPIEEILAGEPVTFRFHYTSDKDLQGVEFTLTIRNEMGVAVASVNTSLNHEQPLSVKDSGTVTCVFPRNPLSIGNYRAAIAARYMGEFIDVVPGAVHFNVIDSVFFNTSRVPPRGYSAVYVDHDWQFEEV